MTIRQLKTPCWVLEPAVPYDDERSPHYEDQAECLKVVADALEERSIDVAPEARKLDGRCWVVQSDGECEQVLDEEDEGWVFHHDSREDAERTAASWGWTYSADGRSVYCPCEPREDSEPIPPSPAELEAAGQLRLPGVA